MRVFSPIQLRSPVRLVATLLAFAFFLLAGTASHATAATATYCGVVKSGGSFCPLESQLPQRHSYYANASDNTGTSACTRWQSRAYIAYEASNGSSPKYDETSPDCQNHYYFNLGTNSQLVRLYMRHFYGSPTPFTGYGYY